MSAFVEAVELVRPAARILTLDIETRPALSYHWGLYDQNISPAQIVQPDGVLCFAAKWYDKRGVEFYADWDVGHEPMIAKAHDLLDEADIVVTWNGDKFDLKHLNRQFMLHGLALPSPYRSLDLLKTSRRQFKFLSHKLDEVAKAVGVGRKISHTGWDLWRRCLEGDPKAHALMARYNRNDVRLTEDVYDVFRPYITNHPHLGLWSGEPKSCNRCGSTQLEPAGFARTALSTYPQFKCGECGAYMRGNAYKNRVTHSAVL